MRLEKVIVNGFKSFADKTEFIFDVPITAIVGPNGCGKSNVVDAVKWVMGEQRVKSLRSDQMTDVIFSGSSSRKAAGAAEVALILSNVDGAGSRLLPVDSDQVQISRKVYRTGDSEYRINGKICRLRDIRDLLMDTGLGAKAYSIIEQGQIDQILGASPTERRQVFEEAAGISKYKAQKKEALRKLDRTEQNLLRLADILGEVGKSLRSVKLQAGKARNYLAYSQRLKELQLNYSLVEYGKYHDLIHDKRTQVETSGETYGALAASVARADTVVSELGNSIIEKEHELSEVGNRLVSARSKIDQYLQRIEFLRSRVQELDGRAENQRRQIDHLGTQAQNFARDLERYERETVDGDRFLQEKDSEILRVQESVQQLDGDMAVLNAELDDEKSGILDIVRRTAQLHNEVRSLGDYRDTLSNQKDRLATRAESARAELEGMLADKAHHKSRLDDIEKVIAELEQNLAAKRAQITELEQALQEDGQHLASGKEMRSALRSELAVLEDMESRYEGLANAVKSLLQRAKQDPDLAYLEGILAEKISTDVDHALAVEAALEGLTDAVVVRDRERLLAHRDLIASLDGRVRFVFCDEGNAALPDRSALASQEGVEGCLLDLVHYDESLTPLVSRLLGKTLVVDSLATAQRLLGQGGDDFRFVTREGQLLTARGHVVLGPLGKTTGLISRKSRMNQLVDAIDKADGEIASLEGRMAEHRQTRDHQSKLCQDLRTSIYEANTEKMQVGSKLTVIEQNVLRLKDEQPLIAGEIDVLETQIAESVQKEYDSKQKLDELEVVNNERSRRIADLEERLTFQREQRQQEGAALTELRVERGQIAEQHKAAKQIMQAMGDQMQAAQRGVREARKEIEHCVEQSRQAQRDILACEAQVSELFLVKEETQVANRSLRVEIEALISQQKSTEQSMRDQRREKESLDQVINDLRVEIGQLEVKLQDLIERVQDELQIDLVASFEACAQQEDRDWGAVKNEIQELRAKIERLGNVNLDAIDEQQALEEPHEVLTQQVEDLNQSKTQLEQLINKINKTSREKFATTFEEVRRNFQQIFRKLFGGGRADVVLEESEDILEAGIEVMAKPPGKETRHISLLSGGEKSMTALALLFAVFRCKPSPFCFLDEVDAALDEANNERFNLLLKEFQADTQFVVITHAKRTMSIADVLFGVTMQTQGVSKKISVKFDEYDHDSAAA